MKRLGTETAFEVLAKAKALEKQGKEIIHLEIGEPDFDTPKNIVNSAKKALDEGYTHYGPGFGLPPLREAIAEHISKTRGINVNPNQVVVTPGGKPIMFFAILACVDEGEEVIYPNPGFPIYESVINFIGAKPVPVILEEDKNFRMDIEKLKHYVNKNTRMLIINSPQNPTGGILTKKDIEQIAEIAIKNNLIVLSDEIYSDIIYEEKHFSIASLPGMQERTIILDGFSKTFAMTGWRLGYGIMPEQLVEHITRLMINSNSCTSSFTQMAGVEALRGPKDDVNKMVAEFKRRRDIIVDGLNKIPGYRCAKPGGAFYVFPNIEGTKMDSRKMADYLLNEAGVAVLSGTAFGKFGDGFLRLSYANSVENINRALEKIKQAVEKL
jgi:aspartate/methionine/tyrosine aminotransferase